METRETTTLGGPHMLLPMVLMVLVSAADEPVSSTPPWPWPTPEKLQPDTGTQDSTQLLEWLVSPEEARRAEAQIRLLDSMPAALPRLEALAARTPGENARGWLRDFLQTLTWRQVSLEQLAPHPTLASLARQGIKQAQQFLSPWETVKTPGGIVEEEGGSTCGVSPRPDSTLDIEDPRFLETRKQLERWKGLARPAIERLLSSPFAPTRLRGMALANSMDLRPSDTLLKRLLKDEALVTLEAKSQDLFSIGLSEVTWSRYPLHLSIARIASDLGWDYPHRVPPPRDEVLIQLEDRTIQWFRASSILWDELPNTHPDNELYHLLNGLRRMGGLTAQDEQDYWNRVRHLWRAWWRNEALRKASFQDNWRWANFVSR